MVFTVVNSTEFTSRKCKNMKMAIWHITTHFVVEGDIYGDDQKFSVMVGTLLYDFGSFA